VGVKKSFESKLHECGRVSNNFYCTIRDEMCNKNLFISVIMSAGGNKKVFKGSPTRKMAIKTIWHLFSFVSEGRRVYSINCVRQGKIIYIYPIKASLHEQDRRI
jgi:hypothetical protein